MRTTEAHPCPQIVVNITDKQAEAMKQLLASGDYDDSSDVLSAALDGLDLRYRLDHADPATMQRLRELWDEGIASGPGEPLDLDAFLVELKARYGPSSEPA